MISTRTTSQQLVEHALAASTADDCIAIVRDVTSANLRWANNTLTTNGVMHGISMTVIDVGDTSITSITTTEARDELQGDLHLRLGPR